MRRYSRKPAMVVLAAAVLVGGAYAVYARLPAAGGTQRTLADLELAVAAPDVSAGTWLEYAERLREAQRYTHAAAAYRKALEGQKVPEGEVLAKARLGLALALGQAGTKECTDDLHGMLSELVYSDPKLVVSILERGEFARLFEDRTDRRFRTLRREANRQVMD